MKERFAVALLVDDDETCCFINKRIIDKMDIAEEIVILRDGSYALEFIRHNLSRLQLGRILLLLDINMPIMSGLELLEHISEYRDLLDMTIIMCTTSSYSRDTEHVGKHKVHGYLNKPLIRNSLTELIEKVNMKRKNGSQL